MCRSKNAGVAGYAEAFRPVQSDSQTSEWYSYFKNDVLGASRLDVIINRQEEAVIAICMNHIQDAVHHIAVVLRRVQPPRSAHMTLMMMIMMISIWTAIMTMTDTTGIAIMRMV